MQQSYDDRNDTASLTKRAMKRLRRSRRNGSETMLEVSEAEILRGELGKKRTAS